MPIKWNFSIAQKGGQGIDNETGKEFEKDEEYKLTISAAGEQEELQSIVNEVAKVIAKVGGQKTLDIFVEA